MSQEYRNVCEGLGCSKEARVCIHVYGGGKSDIMLYLCKNCAKIFEDPLRCDSDKKALEQQVDRPACSNTLSHHNSIGCY